MWNMLAGGEDVWHIENFSSCLVNFVNQLDNVCTAGVRTRGKLHWPLIHILIRSARSKMIVARTEKLFIRGIWWRCDWKIFKDEFSIFPALKPHLLIKRGYLNGDWHLYSDVISALSLSPSITHTLVSYGAYSDIYHAATFILWVEEPPGPPTLILLNIFLLLNIYNLLIDILFSAPSAPTREPWSLAGKPSPHWLAHTLR